jgi:hypothetical protein
MTDKELANRKAFVEDYLKLCTNYGLVIDCVNDKIDLEINSIKFVEGFGPYLGCLGYDMKKYHNYMRGLVQ